MKRLSPAALLRGAVRFRAAGGFVARFLNLCESRGLRVWDLRQDETGLTAFVYACDYRALRLAAQSAGMRLRALEKRGLPFFKRKYRARAGLAVGFVLCAALAVFCSGFLWAVDTVGAKTLGEDEILSAAAKIGVYPGARKPKERGEALAAALGKALNGKLDWAAVNIVGSRAVIELRETKDAELQNEPAYGAPCDLVADFSGQLLSVEVFSGQKANREGNGVKTGDLLISGTREDRDGKRYYYEARGVVTALHDDVRTLTFLQTDTLRAAYAVRRVPVLRLWHLSIPLWFFPRGGDYTAFTDRRSVSLGGVVLPFSLETRTRIYWRREQTARCSLAFDAFVLSCNSAYLRSNLLSGEVRVKTDDGVCRITQRSRLIDFMGVPRPIQTTDG